MFLNSRMYYKNLSLIFGVTPPTIAEVINEMLKKIVSNLKRHPAARISFPNDEEMAHYASLVEQREPRVNNIIGFVDGVAIPVQCSEDDFERSAYYNGYYHDTTVNNVFAFSPTGKIIFACINYC